MNSVYNYEILLRGKTNLRNSGHRVIKRERSSTDSMDSGVNSSLAPTPAVLRKVLNVIYFIEFLFASDKLFLVNLRRLSRFLIIFLNRNRFLVLLLFGVFVVSWRQWSLTTVPESNSLWHSRISLIRFLIWSPKSDGKSKFMLPTSPKFSDRFSTKYPVERFEIKNVKIIFFIFTYQWMNRLLWLEAHFSPPSGWPSCDPEFKFSFGNLNFSISSFIQSLHNYLD